MVKVFLFCRSQKSILGQITQRPAGGRELRLGRCSPVFMLHVFMQSYIPNIRNIRYIRYIHNLRSMRYMQDIRYVRLEVRQRACELVHRTLLHACRPGARGRPSESDAYAMDDVRC